MISSVQRCHIDSVSRPSYLNDEIPYTKELPNQADAKSLSGNEKWDFVGLKTHAINTKRDAGAVLCSIITFYYFVLDLWVKRHILHHIEHNEQHTHRVHSAWEVLRIEYIMSKHILARHHPTIICTGAFGSMWLHINNLLPDAGISGRDK